MLVTTAALALSFTAQDFDPITPISQDVESVALPIVGDFNGDGHDDLVVVSRASSRALLYLLDDAGSFTDVLSFDTGLNGAWLGVAGDLDGDGVADLALYGSGDNSAAGRLHVGLGDGSFAPSSPLEFGFGDTVIGRFRLVDLDGDGDLDIVTVGDGVVVVQNLGGGIFAPSQTIGSRAGQDVAILDVDGDGDLDLVEATTTVFQDGLLLQEQTAPWEFEERTFLPDLEDVDHIEPADFDGDGDQDLVMSQAPGQIIVVENQGVGTFAVASTVVPTQGLVDFEVVDVNRDGRLDLVGISPGPMTSLWVENAGSFVFNVFDLPSMAEAQSKELRLADVNGDSVDDLVLTRSDGAVDLHLSDVSLGAVPYGDASAPIHAVTPEAEDVTVADLDGDGDGDLVLATVVDGIYRLENIGFDSFGAIEQVVAPIAGGFQGTRAIEAIDLDGDEDLDILCVTVDGRVTWLKGDGTGSLEPRILDASGAIARGEAHAADMDADGDLDVLVATTMDSVLFIEQTSPGIFAPAVSVTSVQGPLVGIELTELDGDGVLDIALFTGSSQGTIANPRAMRSSIGNGDGTFQAPALLLNGLEFVGQYEVVESLSSSAASSVLWTRTDAASMDGAVPAFGTSYVLREDVALFNRRVVRFALGRMLQFSAIDLIVQEGTGNAANPARLVVYSSGSSITSLFRGDVVAEGLRGITAIRAADLNGDQAEDILVVSDRAPRLSWLRNRREDLTAVRYCSPAVPNFTGQSARMNAFSVPGNFSQSYVLEAGSLPPNSMTLFLTSKTQGFQPVVPGSIGTLCLGSSIGRFVGPGQVQTSSADGVARMESLFTMIPQPGGFESATTGSLWFYQAWYRDNQGGAAVSNFSDAIAVRFF